MFCDIILIFRNNNFDILQKFDNVLYNFNIIIFTFQNNYYPLVCKALQAYLPAYLL